MYSKDWIEKTEILIDPIIEIYFLISAGGSDEVSTVNALSQIDSVIAAYRSVISNSRSKGSKFNEIEHKFWVRPRIKDSSGQTKHSFSWYDHLDEAFKFLEWLEDTNAEYEFADLDQGWGFAARKVKGNIHMLEFDPDNNIELEHTFMPYSTLLPLYKSVYERAVEAVSLLASAVGDDVWSKYRGYDWDTVKFGNSKWKP